MRVVLASIVLAAPLALMPAAQAQVREDRNATTEIQTGDYELAERKLLAEQRVFPAKPEVLLNLAAIYTKTGRHAEARAIYNRVLALDPVAMDVADGQVVASHLVAARGLRILDSARQASR
ncbi:tetratricopeptide repeat protein [Sphingomonas sp. BT-65]|uniref:tetratricopeptide repeat protein n=1 Tax=Sphingomonas sp. BT-65 TaxID=2989821 RepID=UPI002236A8E6|nr:tetratricopeptide repeat protein [Sphingomonas sp. BT-65]MCW4463307.1 tetratricopeptide repeat protein [Sphingomonas sp. BT-65]